MKSKFLKIINFVADLLMSEMLKKKCIISLCFIAFAVFRTSAQELWTLEQCIAYAYDNNIQLKQMQLSVQQAENNLLQSRLSLAPSVNASGSFNSAKGKVLDENTFTIVDGKTVNSLSANINGNVSLFRGLTQKNTIDRNIYYLLTEASNVEKLKNDLSITIALYYLQIIHAQEQLSVAENQLQLTELQVERTSALVDAGSVPEGDLFEMQAQAAREELQVVTARNTKDISRLNLMQLLDLETKTDFDVEVPNFSNIIVSDLDTSVDELFSTAETILPQIKAAEYNLKSSEKQLSIAQGYRSPTLTLSGGYSTRYSSSAASPVGNTDYPLWDQLKDGINSYVGLGLNIPIFNGWQVQTGVKNAKLGKLNSQYQLELAKTTLYKEIQQAHADALAALQQYLAASKAVTSMEEAFRYTEQRYEVGLMNFVDYTTIKTRLSNAQSDMLQAKFEYIFKYNVLNFYKGQPIRINN